MTCQMGDSRKYAETALNCYICMVATAADPILSSDQQHSQCLDIQGPAAPPESIDQRHHLEGQSAKFL